MRFQENTIYIQTIVIVKACWSDWRGDPSLRSKFEQYSEIVGDFLLKGQLFI